MDIKNIRNSYAITFSRIILAILFLFSGYVKSVDYMGSAIKIEEYIYAFNLDFLVPSAPFFALALCAIEFLIGVLLLMKLLPKLTYLMSLIFMSFFLLLTIYITIANPVNDCGCFGDAVKLSNAETLIKNIIFFTIALYLYKYGREGETNKLTQNKRISLILSVILAFVTPLYSYFFVTNLDFLPYGIGVNIEKATTIPNGAPKDVYETILTYRNIATGEEKNFATEDTSWQDTTQWEFVNSNYKLISKGYTPPISSFDITNKEGRIVTDSILGKAGYTLFVIDPTMDRLSASDYKKLDAIDDYFDCVILTSSDIAQAKNLILNKYYFDTHIFNLDETTLKSLLRADKGIVLMKDGTILAKRNFNDIIKIDSSKDIEKQIHVSNRNRNIIFFSLISVLSILVMFYNSKKQA
ncbi:MAG: DoxX family membrane protein [Rikenellaceae bacterium]